MSNDRLCIALENARYAKVTVWRNEPRLDLRQWEIGEKATIPTKRGISLKLHQVNTLNNMLDSVKEALKKKEEMKWHLGMNIFVSIRKNNPCVNIRQYCKPP